MVALLVPGFQKASFRTRATGVLLFIAQTGFPPVRYLQRLRLRRARLLLEGTLLSVKEVMALVGYNDASHFSRDFRRQHGASPTEFRCGLGR